MRSVKSPWEISDAGRAALCPHSSSVVFHGSLLVKLIELETHLYALPEKWLEDVVKPFYFNIQGVSGREVINYRAGRGLADKYFSHRNPCPEMYSNGDSAPGE